MCWSGEEMFLRLNSLLTGYVGCSSFRIDVGAELVRNLSWLE